MNLIDRVLLEWSVRTEKGYPNLDNPDDLRIFEQLFGFALPEAKRPFSYLSPEAQEVGKQLMTQLGLGEDGILAHSKNRLIVFTDQPRQQVFDKLAQLGYEKDPSITGSSGGGFRTEDGVEIIHKSPTSVGNAGLGNEHIVVDEVQKAIDSSKNLTVVFKSQKGPDLVYEGVTRVKHVGKEGEKLGWKADVVLTDNVGDRHISIKQDGSFRWSSAMKTHGELFYRILDMAEQGSISNLTLQQDEDNPRLLKMVNPQNDKPYGRVFVINAPGMDIDSLAFGPDNAVVVQRTFEPSDFNLQGDVLTIATTKVLVSENDFEEGDQPILQFERNASKATKTKGLSGRGITLRTVPIYLKDKASEKANNLTLDYNDL